MSETKVILKYKRECDSWLCPECDTENSISLGKCAVCNFRKTSEVAILKPWSAVDERAASTNTTTKTNTSTSIFKDDDYTPPAEENETNKNKIIWGIVAAIVIILILIGISQNSNASAYSEAMNEYNNGNYETAIMLFENLPADYKDVSYMIDDAKYQNAMQYFESEDFMTAESLFESIAHYSDSANMITECRYQKASVELNNGQYINAMELFNALGDYSDSKALFETAENNILNINRRNGYFADDYSMIGHWQDASGNSVTYTRQNDGSVNANYSLSNHYGNHYKITAGIHYHSTDSGGWEKQWIYFRIDENTIQIYNYIDGQTYTLSKS